MFTWTKEKPTEKGWFWVKHSGHKTPYIIHVESIMYPSSIYGRFSGHREVEWAGPIPEPKEA